MRAFQTFTKHRITEHLVLGRTEKVFGYMKHVAFVSGREQKFTNIGEQIFRLSPPIKEKY